MNKSQLVDAMAAEAGITKTQAKAALEAFIKVTGKALSKGDRVAMVGFGSFSVVKRPARMGRNPRTGAPLKIAARKAVRFRPGTGLNEKL